MAKLTKAEAKAHNAAIDLLSKQILTEDDKEFVFRNWHEGATHINGQAGAFFTPIDLAFDFAIDALGGPRIIDLCAGIGALSYALWNRNRFASEHPSRIVCVELNADYIAVGRKLLPEAEWIHADALDVLDMGLGRFDVAISNPPFGGIKRTRNGPRYSGKNFEFHIIDTAAHIADRGAFIVPQMSAGFKYSGAQCFQRDADGKAVDFQRLTGMSFDAGCGVDTSYYRTEWRGVSPTVEIVCVDFTEGGAPLVGANDNLPADLFGEVA